MRLALLALCAAALTACSDLTQAVDNTARAGTRGVVAQALAVNFDEVPKDLIEPFTDCVVNNSTAPELRIYAKAAIAGIEEETVKTIRAVLTRPETFQCLQKNAFTTGLT